LREILKIEVLNLFICKEVQKLKKLVILKRNILYFEVFMFCMKILIILKLFRFSCSNIIDFLFKILEKEDYSLLFELSTNERIICKMKEE
jgi:hypothetical protein